MNKFVRVSAFAATLIAAVAAMLVASNSATAVTHPKLVVTPGTAYGAVSCVSKTFCIAVGTDYSGTTQLDQWIRYNGTRWSTAKPLPHTTYGISCVSTTSCVAVGGRYASRFNGTRWTAPQRVMPAGKYLVDVTCTGARTCRGVVASNSGAYVTGYDGSSWSVPRKVANPNGTLGISCVGAFCVVVDGDVVAVHKNGRWTTQKLANFNQLDDVSCVSSTYCVASDYDGNSAIYNGSTWRAKHWTDYPYFRGVSCASKSFCLMVGDNGSYPQARIITGTTYRQPYTVRLKKANTFGGVSCVSASFCAVGAGFVEHR